MVDVICFASSVWVTGGKPPSAVCSPFDNNLNEMLHDENLNGFVSSLWHSDQSEFHTNGNSQGKVYQKPNVIQMMGRYCQEEILHGSILVDMLQPKVLTAFVLE